MTNTAINPAPAAGTAVAVPPVPLTRMLARALTRRCPRCGSGKLFRRYFTMLSNCPRCRHHFEGRPEDGFFLGAFAINVAVTFTALLFVCYGYIAFVASTDGGRASVPVLALGGATALMAPVVFYPFSKTVWAAFELALARMGRGRDIESHFSG